MNSHSSSNDKAPDDDPARIEQIATAYHESGHAVMALSLGRNIQKITIVPGRSAIGSLRLGVCEIKKGRSKKSKDQIEDDVLILFAGMVAEARFTGRYCPTGASQDLQMIARLLQDRARTERQLVKLQRRMLDKTEHLIDDEVNSAAIEMIKSELLEKNSISGRAARHFYEQAEASVS